MPKILNDPRSYENQPKPKPDESRQTDVLPHVMGDLFARSKMGEKKYGTVLQAGNGRDALWDAYQEALDLVMYLRQAILERGQ